MEELWAGVDVSKSSVAVHIRPRNESFCCQNDAVGAALIVKRPQPLAPQLIVLEATGGHEVLLANELALAQLPVAGGQSRACAQLCQSLGQTGENRSHRCDAARSLCRSDPSASSCLTGSANAGVE